MNALSRAWDEYHRLECKLFGALRPRILPADVRAIIRLLKQHKPGLLPDTEFDELMALESHLDDFRQSGSETYPEIVLMMKATKSYSGTIQKKPYSSYYAQ